MLSRLRPHTKGWLPFLTLPNRGERQTLQGCGWKGARSFPLTSSCEYHETVGSVSSSRRNPLLARKRNGFCLGPYRADGSVVLTTELDSWVESLPAAGHLLLEQLHLHRLRNQPVLEVQPMGGDRRKYIQVLSNFCFPEVLLLCTINFWSLVDNYPKSKWIISWLQCRGVGYSQGCFGSGWRGGKGESCCILIQTSLLLLNWVCSRETREQCCPPAQSSKVSVQSFPLHSPGEDLPWCGASTHAGQSRQGASQGAQSGSKLPQGAASGWRVWLYWSGHEVLLGCCARFSRAQPWLCLGAGW